jgi:uncharacterized membrane protein
MQPKNWLTPGVWTMPMSAVDVDARFGTIMAPDFLDYLYTSFTNATAFSPTDTMPLTAWAKLLMMLQSLASLVTVAVVVSRAVNILN